MEGLSITGFAAFGGRRTNTSWRLACALAAEAGTTAHRLDVDHARAAAAVRRLAAGRPAAMVMLGEWSGTDFRIEGCARPGPLVPWAGGVRLARWPLRSLGRSMARAALPVRHSADAGRYVCDTSYWSALGTPVPAVVFVHVPRDWPAARDRATALALWRAISARGAGRGPGGAGSGPGRG